MNPRTVVLALSVWTTMAVELTQIQINPNLISNSQQSNEYTASTNYQPCHCDEVANSCDIYCCCDSQCSDSLVSAWSTAERCANYNYHNHTGMPLADCLTYRETYEFNKQDSIQHYLDPFTQLFCVELHWAPHMDYYYEAKTSISNEEIDQLVLSTTTFSSKLFQEEEFF